MPYCPACGSEYEAGVDRCTDCNSSLVENLPLEGQDVEPNAAMVEIYEATGDKEAIVIKGLLESEGIICSLSSDVPHTVIPVNIDGLGVVRIMVSEHDAERAEEIIASHQTESGEQ